MKQEEVRNFWTCKKKKKSGCVTFVGRRSAAKCWWAWRPSWRSWRSRSHWRRRWREGRKDGGSGAGATCAYACWPQKKNKNKNTTRNRKWWQTLSTINRKWHQAGATIHRKWRLATIPINSWCWAGSPVWGDATRRWKRKRARVRLQLRRVDVAVGDVMWWRDATSCLPLAELCLPHVTKLYA